MQKISKFVGLVLELCGKISVVEPFGPEMPKKKIKDFPENQAVPLRGLQNEVPYRCTMILLNSSMSPMRHRILAKKLYLRHVKP